MFERYTSSDLNTLEKKSYFTQLRKGLAACETKKKNLPSDTREEPLVLNRFKFCRLLNFLGLIEYHVGLVQNHQSLVRIF